MAFSFTNLLVDPALQPFLPFVFVLVIIYGMLSSVSVLRWGDKINMLLAFVFATFAAGYPPFIDFFFANFALLLWFFVGMFAILFISNILRMGRRHTVGRENFPIFIIGLLLVVLLGLISVGAFDGTNIAGLEENELLLIVGLLFLILIFYYAYEHGRRDSVQQVIDEAEARKRGASGS